MKLIILISLYCLLMPPAWGQENQVDYPWLDSMHNSIADSVDSTALWFDDFFELKNMNKIEPADGTATIRVGWNPRSRDFSDFETRFKVRFHLPNLKNRADIIFSDYDDNETENTLSEQRKREFVNENKFSLALRWKNKPNSGLSHRIGIGRKVQPFVKSRYRHLHTLSENTTLSWETAAYYYSSDGLGADLSWRVGYTLHEDSMYRWNNHFYYRDKSNDWLWQHSWQHFKQLKNDSAIVSGLYLEGTSQPHYQLDEYVVSVRWRKNFLRQWLFYELEPFLLWERNESFSASYGFAIRIEGHFGHL